MSTGRSLRRHHLLSAITITVSAFHRNRCPRCTGFRRPFRQLPLARWSGRRRCHTTRRSGISQAVPSALVGASCNAGASDWRGDRPGCSGAFAGLIAGLHRAGNGILTIERGTVPLTLFGSQNYGYRLALIGAPARVARAAAPLVSSLSIELWSVGVLLFSSGLCVAGCGALLLVRAADRQTNSWSRSAQAKDRWWYADTEWQLQQMLPAHHSRV